MGRIKSLMVKRAAKQLLATEASFSESFEHNKITLGNDTMPSKPVRNKIAGYIARLVRMKKEEATKEAARAAKKLQTPVVQEEAPQYQS